MKISDGARALLTGQDGDRPQGRQRLADTSVGADLQTQQYFDLEAVREALEYDDVVGAGR